MKIWHWSRSSDTVPCWHQTLVQRAQTTFPSSQTTSQHPIINFRRPNAPPGARSREDPWCELSSLEWGRGGVSWVKFSDDPGKQTFSYATEKSIFYTGCSNLDGQRWRYVPGREVQLNLLDISTGQQTFKCSAQVLIHNLKLKWYPKVD